MHARAASPAASENEFDISNALFGPDEGESENEFGRKKEVESRARKAYEDAGILEDGDESGIDDAAFIAQKQTAANRKGVGLQGKKAKGGSFQSMGLDANILKAITRKGFSVPTPIQRKAIPMILDGQDIVASARTGSGKTAAFVVPMIQQLKAHQTQVGARALILSPSRELALQTVKVTNELGKGTNLRTMLVVGGDSMEDQFKAMASNPDIIIATPGRFLHLQIEMGLDLYSFRYVVFDEADRLFEMGFAAQLSEILHGLPTSRQTLLFSATLPKSLVEFARAGLSEPKLVRLDAETKVSADLENAFFTVKSAEKEAALLHILNDVIKMPVGATEAAKRTKETQASKNPKKRKRIPTEPAEIVSPTATIIFTATKHHVEYICTFLRSAGFAVSYLYSSLDQVARKMNIQAFRTGHSNILVVTDIAARGVDIPILSNVINYDFASSPKLWVHRVGRTARAGRKGWSYNLITTKDVPYMLDLQLFLSKRLVLGRSSPTGVSFSEDFVVGTLPRERLERSIEWVNKLIDEDDDIAALRTVATKGEKLYNKTRNASSAESAKRAKSVLASPAVNELSLLFGDGELDTAHQDREELLARIRGFRPEETVFEIGKRGTGNEIVDMVRKAREKFEPRRDTASSKVTQILDNSETSRGAKVPEMEVSDAVHADFAADMASASEDELEVTFSQSQTDKSADKSNGNAWEDADHFMSYTPRTSNLAEDRALGVHSGSSSKAGNADFLVEARGATMDFQNDESRGFAEPTRARGMRWDKKSKNYVSRANDEDGSRSNKQKFIRGESGQKIAASFRSGRFDAWKKSNKMERLPRIGEHEAPSARNSINGVRSGSRAYKHKGEKAPKEADKFRDDFFKQKKRVGEAREKRIGRFRDGSGKNELKSVDDVRKQRKLEEKRREKNARPSKKRKT